jgi:adenylate cyclase class 2
MAGLEIEIKAYCDNREKIAERLREIGARHVRTVTERDLYLKHPARDFKKTDEALRIRRADGEVILTYKGPKVGSATKTRPELEVRAGEFDSLLGIFKHLGFGEAGIVVKERDLFLFRDVTVCLDEVEGLGSFVELEKKGTEREQAERELFSLAAGLGLDRFERRSYLELKYYDAT